MLQNRAVFVKTLTYSRGKKSYIDVTKNMNSKISHTLTKHYFESIKKHLSIRENDV